MTPSRRTPLARHRRAAAHRGLRRGATMPLVLVMLVAVIGAAALAVDLAKMTWTTAELQAAADAASLAAARALQTATTASSAMTTAKDAASRLAALNRAGNAAGSAAAADVLPMRYDTTTATRVSASSWEITTTNAVQVTARAAGGYVFGGIFGKAAPALARKSTAWIASVVGASCVRPVSLPYSDFYNIIFRDTWNTTNWGASDMTQALVAGLRTVSPSWRTLVLPAYPYMPSNSKMKFDTWWRAIDYTGGNSMADYGDWIAGRDCDDARARVGTYVRPLDQKVDTWVSSSTTAMASSCNMRGGDAHCYTAASGSTVGVSMRMALTDDDYSRPYGSQGSPWQLTRGVTIVRLMCYFRKVTDVCASVNSFDASGTWSPPYSQTTGYPVGTMVILVDGPVAIDLTSDLVLGTTVGYVQRLLVAQ